MKGTDIFVIFRMHGKNGTDKKSIPDPMFFPWGNDFEYLLLLSWHNLFQLVPMVDFKQTIHFFCEKFNPCILNFLNFYTDNPPFRCEGKFTQQVNSIGP